MWDVAFIISSGVAFSLLLRIAEPIIKVIANNLKVREKYEFLDAFLDECICCNIPCGNRRLDRNQLRESQIMAPTLYQVVTSPPCRAVFMLTRAIALKLDLKDVNITESEHLKPEYLKLNPQHTVPLLDDDGFTFWDSHAINVYLINKYAKDNTLYPNDIKKRAIIDQRLHFDSGVAFSVLRRISAPLRMHQTKVVPENLKAELREVYGFLEAFLQGNTWMCGDFVTLADIHLVATITSAQIFEPLDDKYINVRRWLDNCSKEDWYQANIKGLDERNKLFSALMN